MEESEKPEFECPFSKCGRRFITQNQLSYHIQRRHTNEMKNPKKEKEATKVKKRQKPKESRISSEEQEEIITKYKRPAKGHLTLDIILENSGCENLEEMEQIIIRGKSLTKFCSTSEVDLEKLKSVEYISLSHNTLTEIKEIFIFTNLKELNLNFNQITDIK